ncbi:MAG: OmpA family protein [Myxococcaceae bacterium]|nr:OmpA family protein [Myxococcaceae bacterium]
MVAALVAATAFAQERGFRLHRYEGTTAGSTLFLVERPWYSSTRFFAAGVTADFSLRPLVPLVATGRGELTPIVSQAFVGHVELAGSLFDRVLLRASLPITLFEGGATELVSQVGPLRAVGLGDPRVGVMVRVFGQSERDAFSLHLGADAWIPLGAQLTHQGDTGLRLLPRAVLAGAFGVGRWTFDAGFLVRNYASYGPPALRLTAASEARAGLGVGISLFDDHLYLGPEAQLALQVVGENAFAVNGMALEVLGGATWLIGNHVSLGVAAGAGLLGAAGTPDARGLVRLAWAPRRAAETPEPAKTIDPCTDASLARETRASRGCAPLPFDDADLDGVPDVDDRCPLERETVNGVRDADGCPELDVELAPLIEPKPTLPTPLAPALDGGVAPAAAGRSVADADRDGVPDDADRCPRSPEDHDAFEDEDGCPELDNDRDGIADTLDRCPYEAETLNGVDDDDGCADVVDAKQDADRDGIADEVDRCPLEAETIDGVRDDDGCPEPQAPTQPVMAKLLTPAAPKPIEPAPVTPTPTPTAPPAPTPAPAPAPTDYDKDSITDDADRCPFSPEDLDAFEDEDGCPELDNDADGIADDRDRCADVAEAWNGFEDDDGCPDEQPDVDGDGFAWLVDRCPLEPGGAPDGCPRAPPAALSTFVEAPTPAPTPEPAPPVSAPATPADFDKDGVPDDDDRCPVLAEDRDAFEDDDGCPEPDNDHDGVPDAKDKCPFEAETINGVKDDDGCPDKGAGAVTVTATAVELKGTIQFKTASATLQPSATPLLKQVAATLKAAATLSIEIQGHTDDVGNAVKNIALSKRRAETIRAFLVKAGVPANRLVATGFGPTRPLASNKTAAGREQNRRVEFLILGEAK